MLSRIRGNKRHFLLAAVALMTCELIVKPAVAQRTQPDMARCKNHAAAFCQVHWQALGYSNFTECRLTLWENCDQEPGGNGFGCYVDWQGYPICGWEH